MTSRSGDATRAKGDYTGTIPPGVRVARALREVVLLPWTLWREAQEPVRRTWAVPLLLGAVGVAMLFPFDAFVLDAIASANPGGDLARELTVLGQFGAPASVLIAAYLIWRLDPPRRPRLVDWGVAYGIGWLVVQGAKILIGRPRPRFEDPGYFATLFGAYPLGDGRGVRYPWELWADINADLWSMPSSHSSAAMIMAVALAAMYPRLRAFGLVLAALVGLSRIMFRAHWPTDVVAGLAIGYAVAATIMRARLGQRMLWRIAPRLRRYLLLETEARPAPEGRPCQRCGQDMSGLARPICPECGLDLRRPGGTTPRGAAL